MEKGKRKRRVKTIWRRDEKKRKGKEEVKNFGVSRWGRKVYHSPMFCDIKEERR